MNFNVEINEHLHSNFVKAFMFAIIFNLFFEIIYIKKDERTFKLFSSNTQNNYHFVLDKNLLINLTESFQIRSRQG